MSNIVTATPLQVPAALRGLVEQHHQQSDLTGDLTGGFAVMSIRGRNFRIKYRGEEQVILQNGFPAPYLDVIIVKASPKLAKIYYAKAYNEGDDDAPTCWSGNGIAPDIGVQAKQAPTCAACPNNVWGSKITPQGKPTKACQDSRRIALVPAHDPLNESFGGPVMLRVPPASLQDLGNYGSKLNAQRVPYQAVITRVSFDPEAAYPKLLFQPVGMIDDNTAAVVANYLNDDVLDRMLSLVEVQPAPAVAVTAPQVVVAPPPVVVAPPQVMAQPPAPAPQLPGAGWGTVPPAVAPAAAQPAPVVYPTAQGVINPALPIHPAQPAAQPGATWGGAPAQPGQAAGSAAPGPAPQEPKRRGRKATQPAPAAAPAPSHVPSPDNLDIPVFLQRPAPADPSALLQPPASGVAPGGGFVTAPAPAPQPAPAAAPGVPVVPAPQQLEDMIGGLLRGTA